MASPSKRPRKSRSGKSRLKVIDSGSQLRGVGVDISGWIAGTTYCVVGRWDTKNTLDGTNYFSISVNDTHTFGGATFPGAADVAATSNIGSISTTTNLANALVEGLTIYRRVLYDGTFGTDLGNGDEINLIYAAGAGKKPEEVTGGDDIVFQLPTNGTAEELATGTGEAHSFPWADNWDAEWHLQNAAGGTPTGWTAI